MRNKFFFYLFSISLIFGIQTTEDCKDGKFHFDSDSGQFDKVLNNSCSFYFKNDLNVNSSLVIELKHSFSKDAKFSLQDDKNKNLQELVNSENTLFILSNIGITNIKLFYSYGNSSSQLSFTFSIKTPILLTVRNSLNFDIRFNGENDVLLTLINEFNDKSIAFSYDKPTLNDISVNNEILSKVDGDLILNDEKNIIKISVRKTEFFSIYVDYFDKICTSNQNVEKEISLRTPESNKVKNFGDYKCLNILNTTKEQNLLLNFKNLNYLENDIIEIRDGPSKKSNLLIYLNPPNQVKIEYLANQYSKILSSKNYLYIIISSTNIDARNYKPIEIYVANNIFKNIFRFETDSNKNFDLEFNKNSVYKILFNVQNEKNVRLVLKNSLLIEDSVIKIYDNFDYLNEPILSLDEKRYLYKDIWFSTNKLLIEVKVGLNKIELQGSLKSEINKCQSILKPNSIITLNNDKISKNNECKFYIQSKLADQYTLSLVLNNVYLPSKNDFISLDKIDSSLVNIFKKNGVVDLVNILNLHLETRYDYILSYFLSDDVKTEKILLQGSIQNLRNSFIESYKLDKEKLNVVSTNYPQNYPLSNVKIIEVTSPELIYATFLDFDLYSTDELRLYNNKNKIRIKNIPEDFIYSKNLTFFFKNDLENFLSRNDEIYKGYNIQLSKIKCGTSIEKSPIIYESSLNQDCVWIIDKFNENKINYLDFKLKLNNEESKEFGDLIVYDDTTKLRNISFIINTKTLNNLKEFSFNTSYNKVIIEYHVYNGKKSRGFTLSFIEKNCPEGNEICDSNRCILNSIRCDKKFQCRDFRDELYCNSSFPIPPANIIKQGVSTWIIILIIIPLSVIFGVFLTLKAPSILTMFRKNYYQEFNTFTEDT